MLKDKIDKNIINLYKFLSIIIFGIHEKIAIIVL